MSNPDFRRWLSFCHWFCDECDIIRIEAKDFEDRFQSLRVEGRTPQVELYCCNRVYLLDQRIVSIGFDEKYHR